MNNNKLCGKHQNLLYIIFQEVARDTAGAKMKWSKIICTVQRLLRHSY